MSEATLISLVPFPIAEYKPGIYPGFFELPGARDGKPEVLNIGDSVFHVEIDEDRTITVKCPAEQIAQSVVNDYIVSNLAYSAEEDIAPALFWRPGSYDQTAIMMKFSEELHNQTERQIRWFKKLVQMADDDWERSRQHKFISDTQRYACKFLRLERPWIIVPKIGEGFIKCIACATSIPVEAIVCPNCRCIMNKAKWEEMQFAESK